MQTRSGSNELHGGVRYYRSDRFQARNRPAWDQPLPTTERHQFEVWRANPERQARSDRARVSSGSKRSHGAHHARETRFERLRRDSSIRRGDPVTVSLPRSDHSSAAPVFPMRWHLALIPTPNTEERWRHCEQLPRVGLETFDSDASDARLDGRLHERLNVRPLQRGGLQAHRTHRVRAGGGPAFVTLGGMSKPRNHSLALGRRDTLAFDGGGLRVGFFSTKVDVRLSLRLSAPGVSIPTEPRRAQLGPPEGFIDGPGFCLALAGSQSCNCPLARTRSSFSWWATSPPASGRTR